MPITITLQDLAEAVRVDVSPTTPVGAPYAGILARQLSAASATIGEYAGDLDAVPDAVANEAVVMLVGYILDAPPARPGRAVDAFSSSGAKALLSRYRTPTTATVV